MKVANDMTEENEIIMVRTASEGASRRAWIGTMQNRFLNLDNFFNCLAYDDLMVGISDGSNCF